MKTEDKKSVDDGKSKWKKLLKTCVYILLHCYIDKNIKLKIALCCLSASAEKDFVKEKVAQAKKKCKQTEIVIE